MTSMPEPISFSNMQDSNQMLPIDSQDSSIELNRDRQLQISDENGGHFQRQLITGLEYEPVHANVTLLKAELKAVTNDRDILRRELSKMQSQIEGYKQHGLSGTEKLPPSHNYEWLRLQCDQAMNELQSLKEQHSDTVKKCDSAMSRADMYKQQYEKAKENNSMMRTQYAEVMAERQQLEDEREELHRLNDADRREINELRKQHRELIGRSNSFEECGINYEKIANRYEVLKQEHDILRKKYADLETEVGTASSKLGELQEENSHLRKKNSSIYEENKALQKYLSQNLQAFGLEKKNLVQELTKTQHEKDMVEQRLSQVLAEKLKEMKDLSRLRAERNAAVNEYKLIMSERDTVHKEMEQLQDIITDLNAKVAALINEKSSALDEVERLQHMLRSGNETNDDTSEGRSLEFEQQKILSEFDQMLERTSSERESLIPYSQNGKTEILGSYPRDNVAREVENLHKELDKIRIELMDALHDLEDAKQQRDWAFSERDKIVKERESIRTLCDRLRHERDSAVSELIGALRDSDELKRQKSDVMKELKDLKEKFEALAEKDAQKNRLSTVEYGHSRDSAIDADLQEWETETLELDIGKIHTNDLGFDLVGGSSDPQGPNDPSIFVRSIQPSSAAYGKLKVSDQLIRVNDIDVSGAEKAFVYQVLLSSLEPVHIVVRRRKLASSRAVFPIHIRRSGDREIGIILEQGVYVSRIMSGSSAAKEGNLAIGDRILNINGFSLENHSASEATRLLSDAGDRVSLNILRYCQTPTSSLVSSMSMFSGTNFDGYSDAGGFRSPNDTNWKTPSDELNSSTDGNVVLKTSSSQTDGLDSHHVEPHQDEYEVAKNNVPCKKNSYDRLEEQHEKNLFDKAMNVIARPFRSSRAMRDMRSRSTHPFVNAATIDAWRQQEENLSKSPSPQNVIDNTSSVCAVSKVKMKSHGTWPKCRIDVDYNNPSETGCRVMPRSAVHRPCLSQITRDGVNGALPVNLTDHKIPPLPPVRSDSIKRSASIKHSPQNSDTTTKYSSAKGSFVATNPRCDAAPGETFHDDKASQAYLMDTRAVTAKQKENAYPERSTVKNRGVSVSPSCVPYSLQNSGDQQIVRYVGQKQTTRTVSDLQRRSQDVDTLSNDSRLSEHFLPPQKPTSLDIQPIYSSCKIHNQDVSLPWPTSEFPSETNKNAAQTSAGDSDSRTLLRPIPWTPKKSMESAFHQPSASGSFDQTAGAYNSNSLSGIGMIRPPLGFGSGPGVAASDYIYPTGMMRRSPVSPVSPVSMLPFGRVVGPTIPENPDLELSSSSNKDFNDSQASSSPSPMVSNLYHRFFQPPSSSKVHQQPNDLQGEIYSMFTQRSGRKFHERIRIPSSPSILSSRSSGGAISSPSSYDAINNYLSSVAPFTLPNPNRARRILPMATSNSLPKMMPYEKSLRTRPHFGEIRKITIETNAERLGIHIDSGRDGGIFVSAVQENSAASRAGIEVGDQLLEVCGINMRNANKHEAASVLRQCMDTVEMRVQYNPNKYLEQNLTDLDEPSEDDDSVLSRSRDNFNHGSGSNRARASSSTITPETYLTHMTVGHSSKSSIESSATPESRVIMCKKIRPHDSLGVELVGGNLIGVFIKNILPSSVLSGPKGVKIGDQILEFNNKDFRGLTLEQAVIEVNKPCDQVVCHVQHNFHSFLRTESQSGDGFFVQALYTRSATSGSELSFKRGDILFIENTVLSGRVGTWWAYLVNENGDKLKCGTIPSKAMLDEELAHQKSLADASACQSSWAVRRSFFQRHRHRNSSRDSHDLNSFSDASLNSDSVHHLEDLPLPTLERIEKFDNSILRPVVIIGAFAEQIIKKLTSESPNKFYKYDTDMTFNTDDTPVIEYRTASDGMYKVISISSIQKITNQNCHCLMAVPPETVEKLQKAHIFPIVIFIKYKSPKQIREVKDACFIPEKVSNKVAKDLFEQGQEFEQKYKKLFAESVQGGNLALMCCQIKLAIDKEQKKVLWIPSSATI